MEAFFFPQDEDQLTRFYFLFSILYLLIHLIWDHYFPGSSKFSLAVLQYKIGEVYSSATCATSLFFIVILFDLQNPLRMSDAFIFPLIIAALTGLMISLSAMQPKERRA